MTFHLDLQSGVFFASWIVIVVITLIKAYFTIRSKSRAGTKNAIRTGLLVGIKYTILLWCTFVILTPIPEGGIIFSYPFQEFVQVHMAITQTVVLVLASTILLVYYKKGLTRKYKNWLHELIDQSASPRMNFIVVAFISAVATFAYTFIAQEVLTDKKKEVFIAASIVGVLFTILWFLYVGRLGYRVNLHKKIAQFAKTFTLFSKSDVKAQDHA